MVECSGMSSMEKQPAGTITLSNWNFLWLMILKHRLTRNGPSYYISECGAATYKITCGLVVPESPKELE